MAFQFQSVAAVAPLLGSEFGVSLADIGILIGLYFTPGLALALPGGAIGREFAAAMAIFVNSWPAGIALSLLTLPLIGTAYGVGTVYLAVAALIGFGLVLFAVAYQPSANSVTSAAKFARLDRNAASAVV